jgi:ATP-dependent Zn protease
MDEESKLTAYHEAGYMVVAWELGLNVLGATIIPHPEAGYAGRVAVPVEDYAHMVVRYAGLQAGEKYVGVPIPKINIDVGYASPDSDHGRIAEALLSTAGPDEQDQLETIQLARHHAESLVTSHWSQIEAVAQTLMERETLDERECRRVLESTSNLR